MSHQNLLQAIFDSPDEDTVRLIYADYLEESGSVARAEFIRSQIALDRMDERDSRRPALEDRVHELLQHHEAEFLGVSIRSRGMSEWQFRRGFIEEVTASPEFLLSEGASLCASQPLTRWNVVNFNWLEIERQLEALDGNWLERLQAISVESFGYQNAWLRQLLNRSQLGNLTDLRLGVFNSLGDLPRILAQCPSLRRLQKLQIGVPDEHLEISHLTQALAGSSLTDLIFYSDILNAHGLGHLLQARCCQDLTTLSVVGCPIEPDGWSVFQSAPCRLVDLDISRTPLGAIALHRVLQSPSTARLQRLAINGCGSAMANLQAIVDSPYWQQATDLELIQGTIPEMALAPLFESPGPERLKRLDLSANFLRDGGVAGLCGSDWSASLTYLRLSANYLTDRALDCLATNSRLSVLQTLHLDNNNNQLFSATPHEQITDAGCRSLANSPTLARLRFLNLGRTSISSRGVHALIHGPYWHLSGLGLSGCRFSGADCERIVADLTDSPELQRLEWLDLSRNPEFGKDALVKLAQSAYLSPLLELDITGCGVDPRVHEMLHERLGHRLTF